jgi:hypothetical protein
MVIRTIIIRNNKYDIYQNNDIYPKWLSTRAVTQVTNAPGKGFLSIQVLSLLWKEKRMKVTNCLILIFVWQMLAVVSIVNTGIC